MAPLLLAIAVGMMIPACTDGSELPAADDGDLFPGFRVLLHATTDLDLAREFAREANPLFEEPVHVVHEKPFFKVQLGNCRTRKTASMLLEKAESNGYERIWIVAAMIPDAVEVEDAEERPAVDPIPEVAESSPAPAPMETPEPEPVPARAQEVPPEPEPEPVQVPVPASAPAPAEVAPEPPAKKIEQLSVESSLPPVEVPTIDATPAAAPPIPGSLPTGPLFTVQVLATADRQKARRVSRGLKSLFGRKVHVESHQSIYRVRIGGFSNEDLAWDAKKRVEQNGLNDVWVIKIR